ncbi:phospholipase/carboxylesterase [Paenibacillus barcinonensis]|uniref:Phospholipase/carboxylesterase n=2 Tax=Paenibacillus barcinonensis TaxID=198119 RepID=A0A2V4V561_PAEBA|nr:phospholipase/carboxylesterase [Paenibacillus barcinonensis]
MMSTATMKHIYKAGAQPDAPTMLLLHGTGGTENDLIGLAEMIAPGAAVLGVRGNVSENGMPRFFRRLAEGIFDEEDLIARTAELGSFIDAAAAAYGFDRKNVYALGYSNGANIAASLMFHQADVFKGAILHHPMVPLRRLTLPDLTGLPVFIGAGENDPIVPRRETEELASLLSGAGAAVHMHWERQGHQLTRTEAAAAASWYQSQA